MPLSVSVIIPILPNNGKFVKWEFFDRRRTFCRMQLSNEVLLSNDVIFGGFDEVNGNEKNFSYVFHEKLL